MIVAWRLHIDSLDSCGSQLHGLRTSDLQDPSLRNEESLQLRTLQLLPISGHQAGDLAEVAYLLVFSNIGLYKFHVLQAES